MREGGLSRTRSYPAQSHSNIEPLQPSVVILGRPQWEASGTVLRVTHNVPVNCKVRWHTFHELAAFTTSLQTEGLGDNGIKTRSEPGVRKETGI